MKPPMNRRLRSASRERRNKGGGASGVSSFDEEKKDDGSSRMPPPREGRPSPSKDGGKSGNGAGSILRRGNRENDRLSSPASSPSKRSKEPKTPPTEPASGEVRSGSGDNLGSPNKGKGAGKGAGKGMNKNKKILKGLSRRLSGRFGESNKRTLATSTTSDSGKSGAQPAPAPAPKSPPDNDDEGSAEDDPVVAIFESRNTQRVRFSLEGGEPQPNRPRPQPSPQTPAPNDVPSAQGPTSQPNIKQFMYKALFGGNRTSKSKFSEEMEQEVAKEVANSKGSLVWESTETPTGPEVIHTTPGASQKSGITLSFTEDPKARAAVVKLLGKARRAETIYFRYRYAVKCYVKALDVLTKAKYPDDHPTVQKTVKLLNGAHHVLSSYNNSANIVKMGIKYEDLGELVRALKMYTIAYRIRRDNLGQNHPSLVVLLNMLGSIQIKRGELKEAMQIYELALKDSPVVFSASGDKSSEGSGVGNLLAKSVTHREIGTIYERWGKVDEALKAYHKSLECIAEWKEIVRDSKSSVEGSKKEKSKVAKKKKKDTLSNIQLSQTRSNGRDGTAKGEMEVSLGDGALSAHSVPGSTNIYEGFFPAHLEEEMDKKQGTEPGSKSKRDAYADMDLALTLHQIAQLQRCQGRHAKSLDAYLIALRGMKYALGKHHPNVAAVLGNIGNLQKEMGDMDAAYHTYQEVLGIESYRLGLSHPDVAITLHNIATIDAARGNHEEALKLYRKVLTLQKKLFGEDHLSVSVTAACMGDVYERTGELKGAMESFEEAVRIKSAVLGRHSLEVARLLHKLGKLAGMRHEYHLAESLISRAVLIYRLNKLSDDHSWLVSAQKDTADLDGAIAVGAGEKFEC